MAGPASDDPDASKAPPAPRSRRRFRVSTIIGPIRNPLRPSAVRGTFRSGGGALGIAGGSTLLVGYLSLIVLIPIGAVAAHGLGVSLHTHSQGWAFWHWTFNSDFSGFWSNVTQSNSVHAIWLSLWLSISVAAVNAVFGVVIAMVLVRDSFIGKRLLEGVIDLPFALPTIVAGVVFVYLYGQSSPVHVNLYETWTGLFVALLFVTLPFSVRAVQPVLESFDGHAEDASRSLGASSFRTFVSILMPSMLPAILTGFGLAFARAVGEFGSISLIAGGGLGRTTTAANLIYNLFGDGNYTQAAAVSVALLVFSLTLLASTGIASSRIQRRLSQ
jgi:sulfate/thiosulfate transport system permease protein